MSIAYHKDEPPWNLKDEGWHFELISTNFSIAELQEMKIWLNDNFGEPRSQFNEFMSRWWAGPTPMSADSTPKYLIAFRDNEDRLIYKLRWP